MTLGDTQVDTGGFPAAGTTAGPTASQASSNALNATLPPGTGFSPVTLPALQTQPASNKGPW